MTSIITISYAKSMDDLSPTPQPPQQKTNLYLIGFIIGVLLLFLLLVLNYFNILSLSRLFPSQLGWLPHKAQPTPVQNQDYTPNVFQYDTGKARTILAQYIRDTINPEFVPQTLDIKEGLSIDNRVEDNKRQFGSYFTTSQATFSINFHYKENTNTPNDFSIFIQPSQSEEITLTLDLANSLVASYFINPSSPITNCDKKGTTSYCESFKIGDDGNRGFGALIGQDASKSPPKLTSIVFTCFIPKESKDYDSMKSCISL